MNSIGNGYPFDRLMADRLTASLCPVLVSEDFLNGSGLDQAARNR